MFWINPMNLISCSLENLLRTCLRLLVYVSRALTTALCINAPVLTPSGNNNHLVYNFNELNKHNNVVILKSLFFTFVINI